MTDLIAGSVIIGVNVSLALSVVGATTPATVPADYVIRAVMCGVAAVGAAFGLGLVIRGARA